MCIKTLRLTDFRACPGPALQAIERHPLYVMREPDRTAFRRATARAACLDYRALLDINYSHGTEEINLFGVAVNHLLRDYDYAPPGGQPTTIGSLWDKVDGADKTKALGEGPTSHRPTGTPARTSAWPSASRKTARA